MMPPRIAIIGGGISGLAAAHRVRQLRPEAEVILLEAADRLGGLLQTRRHDGFLIEQAADGFLTTIPTAVDFCRRIGCDLVALDTARHSALVVHRGRLRPIPSGFALMAPRQFWPVATSRVLSLRGKLRLALEPLIPAARDDQDESVAAFVRRRLGREVYDRLVQPLVGGIYSGDSEKLSILATLPQFRQLESRFGSLVRGLRRQEEKSPRAWRGGPPPSRFVAPAEGMSELVARAADQLPEGTIRLQAPVMELRPLEGQEWQVAIGGPEARRMTAQAVILATPADPAARVLDSVVPPVAAALRAIPYASCALVSLAFDRKQIEGKLNGYGFVVPRTENRLILSCSFSSLKYPRRAPEGTLLVRVVIGGTQQSHLLNLCDSDLAELAQLELARLIGLRGKPRMSDVTRRWRVMPQYIVGHCTRRAAIDAHLERFPTLALAGSALRGVGVPHCIQGGEQAADRVLQALQPLQEMVAT